MIEKMEGVDLKKEFPFKPSDFGIQEEAPTQGSDIILDSLGEMPQPSPAMVQTAQATPNVMDTGLTPTEQALLSEEEKQIRLRQRGLTQCLTGINLDQRAQENIYYPYMDILQVSKKI